MLIGDISRRNGRRFPAKTAVVFEGKELSWQGLDARANRLGSSLLSRGLAPGDRVAICARNTGEWPEITFGLAKAGLVLVPINARLSGDEAAYIAQDSGCRAVIAHTDQAELVTSGLGELEVTLEIGGDQFGTGYERAIESGRDVDPTAATHTPDDIHFLLYTSGTTGRPKGVVCDHRAMIAQVYDTCLITEAVHDDVMLATTPFFTAGGMIRTLSWLFLGQTMIIHPRFDPDALLDAIDRQHVTMTTFIPTMLQRTLRLLENGHRADVGSLRRISYGSSPVPPGLAQEAMDLLGCDLQQRYGLTEAGGQVTILTPADHRAIVAGAESRRTSCGRETPQAEIRVVDDDGNDLPAGEVGEVVIRADSMARGYWNNPAATAAAFRPEGLWSGDLGRLDEEGYLHIVGRKTDMIISGGFNIYPAELERVLGAHPQVELVAVIGEPDPEWGETPVAVVVPKQAADTAGLESALRDLSRSQLAGYKQPRHYRFRAEMPLGPAGKILKRELRTGSATQA
ncbi:MAG TPA: AMP-binding protein [Mycobacteriales bacterium]|jgi:acyl-CoA synthetase (AMP-forming)/AMP-acid ligase II|nr:AMP-binding protein [Mycobacteriales bacterium]